jgi:hypothetical protein
MFSTAVLGPQDATGLKPAKEAKWQGHVIRIDKEHSTIDIRGGSSASNDLRKIEYDGSTEWTKLIKAAYMEEIEEGSFVMALGHMDNKSVLHATRVDVRLSG